MKRLKENRTIAALGRIANDYPAGVDHLFGFEGYAPLKPTAKGRIMASALRRKVVSFDDLYDNTFGAYDNLSGNSPAMKAILYNAGIKNSQPEKTKFTSILSGLLGMANQAADVYGKFKNPDQKETMLPETGTKKTPWLLIGGAAVVVVLVIVLLIMKKK